MYGKEFWERVNLQRLCAYLVNGGDLTETDRGTLEERYRREMGIYCDAVRRACQSGGNDRAAEDIHFTSGRMEAISFEAGFLAGLRIGMTAGESGGSR